LFREKYVTKYRLFSYKKEYMETLANDFLTITIW